MTFTLTSTTLKSVRSGVLTLALATSAIGGFMGFTGSAEARVPEGASGQLASDCRLLQQIYDYWHWQTFYAAAGSAQMAKAIERMNDAQSAWREIGCDKKFGSIVARTVSPDIQQVPLTPDTPTVTSEPVISRVGAQPTTTMSFQ